MIHAALRRICLPFVYPCLLVAALLILQGCRGAGNAMELLLEKKAVRTAAERYLDAEVKMDFRGVYDSFAPSSVYRRKNSYEQYLAEAQSTPYRIVHYKVVGISHLTDNQNKAAYPEIEKFVRVEVDVVLLNAVSSERTEANYDFTFIKEEGKWYKG
ncbi:MAG: hypothetical protein C0394_08265 [Syntrophus sp. (in: bacteria)]|nr:hypothetical protein [Syntrophus sp. (in: bacteria)]